MRTGCGTHCKDAGWFKHPSPTGDSVYGTEQDPGAGIWRIAKTLTIAAAPMQRAFLAVDTIGWTDI